MFDRLLEVVRANQEEQINTEKFYIRSKKKFVQYYVPGKVKKAKKFLREDFEKQQEGKLKAIEDDKKLKTFE